MQTRIPAIDNGTPILHAVVQHVGVDARPRNHVGTELEADELPRENKQVLRVSSSALLRCSKDRAGSSPLSPRPAGASSSRSARRTA